MGKFEVNILGCGSALPTARHYPSTQILNIRDNLFMIDCGEGAQIQFRRMRLKFTRLGHIFLSHLHGDHCFGLIGMISTFALVGRTGELVIHAHPQAEQVFRPQLDFFCRDLPFTVRFEPVLPNRTEVIYEDKSIRVRSLPMIHRVPCSGFLFEEKVGMRHLLGDMMNFYNVPVYRRAAIKAGEDFVTSIEGVDLLYHEATFGDDAEALAKETCHSTARQAAIIARKAGVKQLLLGHFSARYEIEQQLLEQAREEFAPSFLAREELKIILGR